MAIVRMILVFLAGMIVGIYFFAPEQPTLREMTNAEHRRAVFQPDEARRRAGDVSQAMADCAGNIKDFINKARD